MEELAVGHEVGRLGHDVAVLGAEGGVDRGGEGRQRRDGAGRRKQEPECQQFRFANLSKNCEPLRKDINV